MLCYHYRQEYSAFDYHDIAVEHIEIYCSILPAGNLISAVSPIAFFTILWYNKYSFDSIGHLGVCA